MAMALLLKRPSLLAYPGGNPGFDPSHPAAQNNLLCATALRNGNFINLAPGFSGSGTIGGSASGTIDTIGPAFAGGSPNTVTIAPAAALAANAPLTLAAIVRVPSTTLNNGIFGSVSGAGPNLS